MKSFGVSHSRVRSQSLPVSHLTENSTFSKRKIKVPTLCDNLFREDNIKKLFKILRYEQNKKVLKGVISIYFERLDKYPMKEFPRLKNNQKLKDSDFPEMIRIFYPKKLKDGGYEEGNYVRILHYSSILTAKKEFVVAERIFAHHQKRIINFILLLKLGNAPLLSKMRREISLELLEFLPNSAYE